MTTNRPSTPSDSGYPGFATTHWSVVLAAGDHSRDEVREALARLCETYWYPLYAYIRRRTASADEARDLTQEFFCRLLEKDYVGAADPARGRFRAFLLTACRNFLSRERDRARAKKRGGGRVPFSLDLRQGETRYQQAPHGGLTAEQIYQRQWAVELLERVLGQLETEYRESGKGDRFDSLKELMTTDSSRQTHAEVAELLGTSEAAAKMAAHRMRKRYQALLRNEIARTVGHIADVEDEIRSLFEVFSR